MLDLAFYKNKRVLITGHTGFKGSWLLKILLDAGANLFGYSLPTPTAPSLFEIAGLEDKITHFIGDIRDIKSLKAAFGSSQPEIVFHLAAQPLVRRSYAEPALTYETNVMGTVNILECVRNSGTVKSFVNVTTDKVYLNREWEWGYREDEQLDGLDPYSNSKSCSELITHSYAGSFFTDGRIAISTARAGNVIGGGDFATDRIIPDCVRAAETKTPIILRNPQSVRPYQHVIEPLFAYLLLAERQFQDATYQGWYNIGPDEDDCITTGKLVELFKNKYQRGFEIIVENNDGPHEANLLKLDCSKFKNKFNWKPRWSIDKAIAKTVEWTKCYFDGGNIEDIMSTQIQEYIEVKN